MNAFSRILHALRPAMPPPAGDAASGRRQFFRRSGGAAVAALGAGVAFADTAHAETFGITPGTVVDQLERAVPASGTDPLLGEITMGGWNFVPRGFALCDGQMLAIAQHTALFPLLGTLYGGDDRTTFAVPDLRGRVPVHQGRIPVHQGRGSGLTARAIGARLGAESRTLTTAQMPSHTHGVSAHLGTGDSPDPSGRILANPTQNSFFSAPPGNRSVAPTQASGGSQSVDMVPPALVINFVIALQGVYPSRS